MEEVKRTFHGETGTRFHHIWCKMRRRCRDKNYEYYHDYGGRGIKVCEQWKNYLNFKKDMYESYLEHLSKYGEINTTLERKNANGNYQLDNCCWATRKEQTDNRRTPKNQKLFEAENCKLEIKENFNNIAGFAKKYNLHISAIYRTFSGEFSQYKGWKLKRLV